MHKVDVSDERENRFVLISSPTALGASDVESIGALAGRAGANATLSLFRQPSDRAYILLILLPTEYFALFVQNGGPTWVEKAGTNRWYQGGAIAPVLPILVLRPA